MRLQFDRLGLGRLMLEKMRRRKGLPRRGLVLMGMLAAVAFNSAWQAFRAEPIFLYGHFLVGGDAFALRIALAITYAMAIFFVWRRNSAVLVLLGLLAMVIYGGYSSTYLIHAPQDIFARLGRDYEPARPWFEGGYVKYYLAFTWLAVGAYISFLYWVYKGNRWPSEGKTT